MLLLHDPVKFENPKKNVTKFSSKAVGERMLKIGSKLPKL